MSEPDNWIRQIVITIDPQKIAGAPVIRTLRFPVASVWRYIREGRTIESLLKEFPELTRDDILIAMSLLEAAERFLADSRSSATA